MKHRAVKKSLVVALVLLPVVARGWGDSSTRPLPSAAALESITPEELRAHVEFLASDELGGRYVASSSNHIAARYLASQLRRYGYRGGAADGSFFQKFDISVRRLVPDRTRLEITGPAGKKTFSYGRDFILFGARGTRTLDGEMVFVRHGVSLPEVNYDDYAKMDVKGKIVVATFSTVPAVTRDGAPLTSRNYPWNQKVATAAARGAQAIILLRSPQEGPLPRFGGSGVAEQVSLASDDPTPSSPIVIVFAGPELAAELCAAAGISPEALSSSDSLPEPKSLGLMARLDVAFENQRYETQNVIGILDGSDPQRRNEYVVISAHYDHVQTRNGQIYNGADDDGSGTSAVLEIAQAFTIGERPKRSILIIFHTAEEVGLLGSRYFVMHPTVPLTAIVANLNIDMIGRSRSPQDTNPANRELSDANTLYLIGSDKLSRELHELSEQTNQDTEKMVFDYRYNREDHPERLYYRSDHYNYARNGIPVIFYFTGLHEDYHRPTDDVEKLDFQKMTRITRLIFATGWRIANLDHRLKVDGSPPGQRPH
ncbi:MAG TPA: M28 family peptidase [Blastocatellia bacterium]|nr:M28 family peptidase [Blastocatellia bacterium]